MKTLMLHHIHDWMLDLDCSEFDILTFDDGLESQYKYHEHFNKFKKPMYFFISTSMPDTGHHMSWKAVKELSELYNVGGHSHNHPDLRNTKITSQLETVKNECQMMMAEFEKHEIKIDSFCFPYNYEALGYRSILKSYGIEKFFGSERIDVDIYK